MDYSYNELADKMAAILQERMVELGLDPREHHIVATYLQGCRLDNTIGNRIVNASLDKEDRDERQN